jgi:hypothetical protein
MAAGALLATPAGSLPCAELPPPPLFVRACGPSFSDFGDGSTNQAIASLVIVAAQPIETGGSVASVTSGGVSQSTAPTAPGSSDSDVQTGAGFGSTNTLATSMGALGAGGGASVGQHHAPGEQETSVNFSGGVIPPIALPLPPEVPPPFILGSVSQTDANGECTDTVAVGMAVSVACAAPLPDVPVLPPVNPPV